MKREYDYVLIDCSPSLGMITVNALVAADSVIIPVQSHYLPTKGMRQLLSTVTNVKRALNPKLRIDGALLTMVDSRTNLANEVSALRKGYAGTLRVFKTEIPLAIGAGEAAATGRSIYEHDPNGKVAAAYNELTKEVTAHVREKSATERSADCR